jgi:hypothetical protein
MGAEQRIKELGLDLPPVPKPAGNYVGAVRTGNLLFMSGCGSRSAVGMNTLPFQIAVEVEMVLKVIEGGRHRWVVYSIFLFGERERTLQEARKLPRKSAR